MPPSYLTRNDRTGAAPGGATPVRGAVLSVTDQFTDTVTYVGDSAPSYSIIPR